MEKNAKIGILGGGIEGLAAAAYLDAHGYLDVTIYDEKVSLESEPPVPAVLGSSAFDSLDEMDVLFRSPGIHPSRLKGFGGKITSTIQFFLEEQAGKVIGVTGTKGKGTTSALIYEILKEDGRDVHLGGNIGESPLKFLDDLGPDSWTVLELSSFQLMDVTISPHVAVILMTTTEHLDYHEDLQEYLEAKTPIAKFQDEDDFLVVNMDYDSGAFYVKQGKGRKIELHLNGADPPSFKVALPGPHNIENVMAAVSVARALEVPDETIFKVVGSFTGLEHRLELVRDLKGVKFYNDSFSTTPETSIAAARAFQAPTSLICGGSEKHSDFTDWGQELQNNQNVKSVFLLGVTADRMEEALKKAQPQEFPVKVYREKNLEEAVKRAAAHSHKGDYVIMSPAAASFDMFKNYKERGKRFREIVRSL